MRSVQLDEPDGRAARVGVQPPDVAQHAAAPTRRLEAIAHGRVQLLHSLEKLVHAAGLE